jgi:hypothetical protein
MLLEFLNITFDDIVPKSTLPDCGNVTLPAIEKLPFVESEVNLLPLNSSVVPV